MDRETGGKRETGMGTQGVKAGRGGTDKSMDCMDRNSVAIHRATYIQQEL